MDCLRTRPAGIGLIAALALSLAPNLDVSAQSIDFQRDVLPLLSDRCFMCHGPDEGARQAAVRVDTREGLLEHVIPGDAEASNLWHRIHSADESERMPPPESRMELSGEEQDRIRQWIDQGAAWSGHWSLQPPASAPELPAVRDAQWPVNPIDTLVLARLESEGRVPNREAPRWRWLRRVTLDLTGLPPTPEEVQAFEADSSPDAFETVVDRLLASPRFGEHLATSWLDAARYADSWGYQSDLLSPMWPWRDWVIDAINDNLPYDEFLTWQIAGDLLPDATREQVLATAFNRLHRMTNEGGSIEQEWRTEYVADRVHTFGAAMMGLTLECARCHDHKYDPLTQQDYYNLFAFFNNIDEWGMYNDSARVPTPSLLLPSPEDEQALGALKAKLDEAHREVEEFVAGYWNPVFKSPDETICLLTAEPVAAFDFEEVANGNQFRNLMDEEKPAENKGNNLQVDGRNGKGIQFSGDDEVGFPLLDTGLHPWERFAVSMWIRVPRGRENAVILHHSGGTDTGFHGTELTLVDGKLQFAMIRFWPGNALAIRTRETVPFDEWIHVVIANEASGSARGLSIYVNGRAEAEIVRDELTKSPDPGGRGFSLGARFRSPGFEGGMLDDLAVYDRPLSAMEIKMIMNDVPSMSASDATQEQWIENSLNFDWSYEGNTSQRAERYREFLLAQTLVMEVPVMRECAEVREAHVLARGQYDAPRTASSLAKRATPAALPGMSAETPRNRLGLARWLTDPRHPLTARVAVNRLWANFFGEGLVATMNDFGVQGERPAHGPLLDWLAVDFAHNGWDVKRFCRQVVLSRTYRQDSSSEAADWTHDPQNRNLARGPSRRLSAEMIRDTALFASGLLDLKAGGPPVSPYQPENLWRENNSMTNEYQQSTGKDLYRRSVYSVWKRTAPLPNMIVFDAAGREVCSMNRPATSTPLQALVLFNDPQFVEAARVLAARAAASSPDDSVAAIDDMFLRLCSRLPDTQERTVLLALYEQQAEWFAAHPDEARSLLAVGEFPLDSGLQPDRVAALTIAAQAILGSDAALWSR